MRIERAVALLVVTPADVPLLDSCLERLVAAADEAAAAGLPTTLAPLVPPGPQAEQVLDSWRPLVELVEDVRLRSTTCAADPLQALASAARAFAATLTRPAATVLLTTAPPVAVGSRWITEHAHHHAAGAAATTGPVRGIDGPHPARLNLAVRADLFLRCGGAALTGDGDRPLVHVLTPAVGLLRTGQPASP